MVLEANPDLMDTPDEVCGDFGFGSHELLLCISQNWGIYCCLPDISSMCLLLQPLLMPLLLLMLPLDYQTVHTGIAMFHVVVPLQLQQYCATLFRPKINDGDDF